jgi:hypothetical protein
LFDAGEARLHHGLKHGQGLGIGEPERTSMDGHAKPAEWRTEIEEENSAERLRNQCHAPD